MLYAAIVCYTFLHISWFAQDERHDRCLLQGDSGTHSVTDSYDLNSFGSYVDSDEENHEVRGLPLLLWRL